MAARRITAHQISTATHEVLILVEQEPKATQLTAVVDAMADCRQSLRGGNVARRVTLTLIDLAAALQAGVPFRLTQRVMRLLLDACEYACASHDVEDGELLVAAVPLWRTGLSHPNRDVRASTLALLARLCAAPTTQDLPPSALDRVLDCGVATHLAAILCGMPSAHQLPQVLLAVMALRGLLRSVHAAARCRESGLLASQLQAMPSAVRQGPLASVTAELLLRLGEIGSPSALGQRLRRALLDSDAADWSTGTTADAPCALPADAEMVWPDGSTLSLHRVLLAVRAPDWLQLVVSRARRRRRVESRGFKNRARSRRGPASPADGISDASSTASLSVSAGADAHDGAGESGSLQCSGEAGDTEAGSAGGRQGGRQGVWQAEEAEQAEEVEVEEEVEEVAEEAEEEVVEEGTVRWWLTTSEASALPREACVALYQLVASTCCRASNARRQDPSSLPLFVLFSPAPGSSPTVRSRLQSRRRCGCGAPKGPPRSCGPAQAPIPPPRANCRAWRHSMARGAPRSCGWPAGSRGGHGVCPGGRPAAWPQRAAHGWL